MRTKIITVLLCFVCFTMTIQAQEIDTLVDVGGYKLHFHVIKGIGTPVIFESGGGDDGNVWQPLVADLHQKLNAPLITYDRAGFGKSGIDTSGWAVFIDINTPCFMTEEKTREIQQSYGAQLPTFKKERPGVYFLLANYQITNQRMREAAPKVNMPIIVVASDHPPYRGADSLLWKNCLKSFVLKRKNRKYKLATNTSHYVFKENPELVLKEIVTLYQDVCLKN